MDSKLEDLDPKSGVQQLENEPTELRENYVKPGMLSRRPLYPEMDSC